MANAYCALVVQLMLIHERSYRGASISSVLHRFRLRRIMRTIRTLSLPKNGRFADYGCSTGFLFEVLLNSIPEVRSMALFGFDHSEKLLEVGRLKNIDNAVFRHVNLNVPTREYSEQFDLVTCFETLEHVGDITNALSTLISSCKTGGTIVLSLPNEIGIPGLVKYVGRRVLRKNAYGDFFNSCSELRYFWHLLAGKPIEIFRTPAAAGWGPHLGFDWRSIDSYLRQDDMCKIVSRDGFFFGFIYVIKKQGHRNIT